MNNNFKYSDLTELIIQCFYRVYNELGSGFLEKVYQNAFLIELQKEGLNVESQKKINVYYQHKIVGEYSVGKIEDKVFILELKAAEKRIEDRGFQLIDDTKATDIEAGVLLNLGEKSEMKRKVFTNKILQKSA